MADEDEDMYEPTADDDIPTGPAKPKDSSSEEEDTEEDSDSVNSTHPPYNPLDLMAHLGHRYHNRAKR